MTKLFSTKQQLLYSTLGFILSVCGLLVGLYYSKAFSIETGKYGIMSALIISIGIAMIVGQNKKKSLEK